MKELDGEEGFLRALEIQFEIAVSAASHAERVYAFKVKADVEEILLKVFRAMGATGFADFSSKGSSMAAAITILHARELLKIDNAADASHLLQVAFLKELGIEATESELHAYVLYAQHIAIVASQILGGHMVKIMKSP